MSRVLVVDDDAHILRTLEIMLQADGREVVTAGSGEEGLALLEKTSVDIALIDLQLPGMSGTELLDHLRARHPRVEAIIITAHGSIENAVQAMKKGAYDYITKPFGPEVVRHQLQQIEQVLALRSEVAGLRRRLGDLPFKEEFLTRNAKMLQQLELARSVAGSDATVLINGESGTGKTLLARLIHSASPRAEGPFVTVDCTSFQESLLESELFGHKRGSFTGAVSDKPGKVETAEGGTLFLDEIGEVPAPLQGKLLRLVEERTYERVGDPAPRRVDARIVAATNRDLEEMVRERDFRRDLFYRLSVVEIAIPPLRTRPEDVLLLARSFMEGFGRAEGKALNGWNAEFERALLVYGWPGNVRELANALERAVLLALDTTLHAEHLPRRIVDRSVVPGGPAEILSLAEVEERHIRVVLDMGLPLEEVARRLGINSTTLWRKRKKYGI